jgi:hypothetical protein
MRIGEALHECWLVDGHAKKGQLAIELKTKKNEI